MKLIIAGGRDYHLTKADIRRLDKLCRSLAESGQGIITEIVSGGATGADRGGENWALSRSIPLRRFTPDWTLGRTAGPLRNIQMAQHADAVVLFPGGAGTTSMFKEAKKAGIRIFDWREQE